MYELIIMDLYMPICNGLEATKSIRKYLKKVRAGIHDSSTLVQPYMCLLTSNGTIACQEQALISGIDCVITKPIFKVGIQKLLIKSGLLPQVRMWMNLLKHQNLLTNFSLTPLFLNITYKFKLFLLITSYKSSPCIHCIYIKNNSNKFYINLNT